MQNHGFHVKGKPLYLALSRCIYSSCVLSFGGFCPFLCVILCFFLPLGEWPGDGVARCPAASRYDAYHRISQIHVSVSVSVSLLLPSEGKGLSVSLCLCLSLSLRWQGMQVTSTMALPAPRIHDCCCSKVSTSWQPAQDLWGMNKPGQACPRRSRLPFQPDVGYSLRSAT